MKHIKEIFEDFESDESEDVLQTLKDICQDIKDDGFTINFINNYYISKSRWTSIYPDLSNSGVDLLEISKPKLKCFKLSEVKDVVDRIKLYLGNNFNYCMTYNYTRVDGRLSDGLGTYIPGETNANIEVHKIVIIYNRKDRSYYGALWPYKNI